MKIQSNHSVVIHIVFHGSCPPQIPIFPNEKKKNKMFSSDGQFGMNDASPYPCPSLAWWSCMCPHSLDCPIIANMGFLMRIGPFWENVDSLSPYLCAPLLPSYPVLSRAYLPIQPQTDGCLTVCGPTVSFSKGFSGIPPLTRTVDDLSGQFSFSFCFRDRGINLPLLKRRDSSFGISIFVTEYM